MTGGEEYAVSPAGSAAEPFPENIPDRLVYSWG